MSLKSITPSQKPKVVTASRFPLVRQFQAQQLGVAFTRGLPPLFDGYIETVDVWIEAQLPADPRWTVAYRVVPGNDSVVVTEVRVFPNENRRRPPAEWSAELLGHRANKVPGRGLSTKALRSIRLADDVHSLTALINELRADAPTHADLIQRGSEHGFLGAPYQLSAEGALGEAGFAGKHGSKLRGDGDSQKGRGRPRLAEHELLAVASAYAEFVERGSKSPRKDVAAKFRLPESTARMRISMARKARLLERKRPGQASGALTDRAVALLKNQGGKRGKKTRTR